MILNARKLLKQYNKKGMTFFLLIIFVFSIIEVSRLLNEVQVPIVGQDPDSRQSPSNYEDLYRTVNELPAYISSNYIEHSPIDVADDVQLASVASKGTGIISDPYVIENLSIITDHVHGIHIRQTTKYFVIRNCWITSPLFFGIYLYNNAPGTVNITNNICVGNDYGIYISNSDSSQITNNICNRNYKYGLGLSGADSCIIINNSLKENYYGLKLSLSTFTTVLNNTITNNSYGVDAQNSHSSIIINNTIKNNVYTGMKILSSLSMTIAHNQFIDDGLQLYLSTLSEFFSNTIFNNWVNEKLMVYMENATDFTLSGSYGQIILVNCTNGIIKDCDISYTDIGLTLYSCTQIEIKNNTFFNNSMYAVYLRESNYSTIVGSYFSRNYYGLYFLDSEYSTVANNTINENGYYGLYAYRSANFTSINNSINNNYAGLALFYSPSSTITNNSINDNSYYGIYWSNSGFSNITNVSCNRNNFGLTGIYSDFLNVSYSSFCENTYDGLSLFRSDYTIIKNNSCNQNANGIEFFGSVSCTIINNSIEQNFESGLDLEQMISPIIADNEFIEDGIKISESSLSYLFDYTVTDNLVNGQTLYYKENATDFTLSGSYGQIILVNSTRGIINGYNCSNTDSGISLYYCENVTIQNSYFNENDQNGIYLYYANSTAISNTSCIGNNAHGIYAEQAALCNFTGNIINLNSYSGLYGIYFGLSKIVNNSFNENEDYGVSIGSSVSCIVANNSINKNGYLGLRLGSRSDHSLIADNSIIGNEIGIYISDSNYITVYRNLIVDSIDDGILLIGSNHTRFHHNSLINNGFSYQIRIQDCLDDIWYEILTHEGNYWSDWEGIGSYEVYLFGQIDRYPLDSYDFDDDGMTDLWEWEMGTYIDKPDETSDPDEDGLTNIEELILGLNPKSSDTDEDAISDGWEATMGLNASDGSDADLDKDIDGLPNIWEYQMGLNASDNSDAGLDKDVDGLPNIWEYQMGLNALVNDSLLDLDDDGLNNLLEYQLGLNASNSDSDNDGFSDKIEVDADTDPLDALSFPSQETVWSTVIITEESTETIFQPTSSESSKSTSGFQFVIIFGVILISAFSLLIRRSQVK